MTARAYALPTVTRRISRPSHAAHASSRSTSTTSLRPVHVIAMPPHGSICTCMRVVSAARAAVAPVGRQYASPSE